PRPTDRRPPGATTTAPRGSARAPPGGPATTSWRRRAARRPWRRWRWRPRVGRFGAAAGSARWPGSSRTAGQAPGGRARASRCARSAPQQVEVVGLDGPAHAEDHDDDGEADRDFGHRDGDGEQREDQPGQVVAKAREGYEVDVHGVEHQLDAEQDADGVLAREHAEEP